MFVLCCRYCSGPRPHECGYFWKLIVFSVVAFRPQGNGVVRHQNARFQKRSPGWRFLSFFENAGFSMSYIIQRMSCKEFNCMSIVLAFSCRRAKTILIRYVWTRIFWKRRKKSAFSKISMFDLYKNPTPGEQSIYWLFHILPNVIM